MHKQTGQFKKTRRVEYASGRALCVTDVDGDGEADEEWKKLEKYVMDWMICRIDGCKFKTRFKRTLIYHRKNHHETVRLRF